MRQLTITLSALCLSTISPQSQLRAQPINTPVYQGVSSCSSSNCHGNVNPLKGATVLQNEYVTWLKRDPHSKAYLALTTTDAARMTKHLGLGSPTKEKICLECHTTYVPEPSKRGERYSIEDGVSCESCHGAAQNYLSTHTQQGATHQQNLTNGLTDTASLDSRAQLCLSCHYGDDTKRVTHDLYGAGHPRLRFELDTYSILEPKHWLVDQDYINRKGAYVPVKAWLYGQAFQAKAMLTMLQNPHTARNGVLPEFSHFDCFSCHHDLSQQQWKERTYGDTPGQLKLNTTPLIVLQAAFSATDPALAAELAQLTTTLNQSYLKTGAPQTITTISDLLAQRALPLIKNFDTSEATLSSVIIKLSEVASESPSPKFELAEQIGMGIQSTIATSPTLAHKYGARIKQLFSTIRSSSSYRPAQFNQALRKLTPARPSMQR